MRHQIVTVAVLVSFIAQVEASCPNQCSGHGACSTSDKCLCQQNWIGGDCSLRVCQYSLAWVDTAGYQNAAHYYAECSNRGSCDRKSGQCKCVSNFEGSACRRQSCPNACNGHGTCQFIEQFGADTFDKRFGSPTAIQYNAWDQEKMMGCKCDPGYAGFDCSNVLCPVGDDPLTLGQTEMAQYIMVGGGATIDGGQFYLTYFDQYGMAWNTQAITFSQTDATTCANIQTALRNLPNRVLDTVVVQYTASVVPFTRTQFVDVNAVGAGTAGADLAADANYVQCKVSFPPGPGTEGLQYLLGCDVTVRGPGNQPVSSGLSIAGVYTNTAVCNVGEWVPASTQTRPLTESAPCSNRGICDDSSGVCQCFAGHKGIACEIQDALV